MTRSARGPVQLTFDEPAGPSPRTRRALRRGPRHRIGRPPPARPAGQAQQPAARPLSEWHAMTPGGRLTAWAGLRAWVTWLHDRYELSADDRLPRCWAEHPGLVEELFALKVWREEIYSGPQPSGQAARYWHSELRQIIHAATTVYAAGCRTGHRTAPALAAPDRDLQQRWAAASPLAGIPAAEQAAALRSRRQDSGWLDHAAMAAAVDAGQAREPGPGLPDVLFCASGWWAPVSAGWVRVSDPGQASRRNNAAPGHLKEMSSDA
jgi:hypothetical protein